MPIGNARGGVLGDALASVLERAGYDVWREFYVNDAGNQIEKFASSIDARYRQLILGEDKVEFPEDGYHGDDIKELAKGFYDIYGEDYLKRPRPTATRRWLASGLTATSRRCSPTCAATASVRPVVLRVGAARERLRRRVGAEADRSGFTYEKDGALWLRTSRDPRALRARPRRDEVLRRRERVSTPILPPTSPITATSSKSAALTASSTSGAPTTTATSPASRARWTRWVLTASTGSTSC